MDKTRSHVTDLKGQINGQYRDLSEISVPNAALKCCTLIALLMERGNGDKYLRRERMAELGAVGQAILLLGKEITDEDEKRQVLEDFEKAAYYAYGTDERRARAGGVLRDESLKSVKLLFGVNEEGVIGGQRGRLGYHLVETWQRVLRQRAFSASFAPRI